MSTELEWPRLAIEVAGSAASAVAGAAVAIWRWGRRSAQREHGVRSDINSLGEELRLAMTGVEKTGEQRLDVLVDQFKESFNGMRRQIDDDRLHTEQNFLRKDDFRAFRDEYREDMRDLKRSIGEITKK